MIESIEQLLQIQDDKGRIIIPPNVRKILKITSESIVKLTYLKLENKEIKGILPYSEQNSINKTYRFQTTKYTRDYLNLKTKDFIYTRITKIS